MAIQGGRIQKSNKKSLNAKGKGKGKSKGKDKKVGHCKRNCPAYLVELIKKKMQVSTTSSSGKMTRKLFPHRTERTTGLLGIIHIDDYALKTATRILKMVPTKKVDKTPYELWYGKVPNLSYLKGPGILLIRCNLKALVILIIPGKYASFKDLFMVLSKHQEAGIKDLMRKIKSLDLLKILTIKQCVHQKASGSNVTFLILYVDDIIIMGNHIPSLQSVKSYLGKCFAMKDLGEAAFILGIKIYQDRLKRLIRLSQYAYMDEILKGSRWIIPNMNPGKPHWTAIKTILKYLRNTKDMFLVYDGNPEAELRVDFYCNYGFETNRDDINSQTGYSLF
ncbi:retrotransposon protein, putative, ty1-copia subclass [Tanacetum coccineum]